MRALVNVLELQEYKIAKHREVVELTVYSAVCFLIPFLLGHPQLVVGTVVNAALILSALNLPKHKVLPAVILPSLGVISRGLVFGPFTHLLIITMPFIWLGNYVLILTIKYLYLAKRSNKFLAICIAIMLKVAIIYLAAILLINSGVLPKIFATSMGLTQIYTAVLGALLALSINKLIKSNAK